KDDFVILHDGDCDSGELPRGEGVARDLVEVLRRGGKREKKKDEGCDRRPHGGILAACVASLRSRLCCSPPAAASPFISVSSATRCTSAPLGRITPSSPPPSF